MSAPPLRVGWSVIKGLYCTGDWAVQGLFCTGGWASQGLYCACLFSPPAKAALEKRVEQLEKDHQELLNENIRITEDSHSLVRALMLSVWGVSVYWGSWESVCVGRG